MLDVCRFSLSTMDVCMKFICKHIGVTTENDSTLSSDLKQCSICQNFQAGGFLIFIVDMLIYCRLFGFQVSRHDNEQ